MRESQPIVELLDVRKAFGGVPVLSGVSFSISKGSVHGLIGGNGAGKSTLMKIMSGVYQPDGGIIRVEGREVTLRSPWQPINVAFTWCRRTPRCSPI